MKTSLIPTSILDKASVASGFVAGVAVLTPGLLYLMRHMFAMEFWPLAGVEFGISALSLLASLTVRTLSLAAMVRLARGREALEWCAPSECATFAGWLGSSWGFPGAGGWQEGIRVFGLGIALSGTHGNESAHG